MTETKVCQKIEITPISKEKILFEKLRKECEHFELAKEYLSCDFENGLVISIKKLSCRSTRIKIGSTVGCKSKNRGYIDIGFQNKQFRAHRYIFYCYHGYLPEFIDHENQIRDDNRILNLRSATFSENQQNTCIAKNNKSGCQGVFFNKRDKIWSANIYINGKRKELGCFKFIEEAIAARKAAELLYYPFKYQGN